MAATKSQQMDTGWAWVVLACSWLSLFFFTFLTASAGIMQVEIIEDLKVGSGPISIMTSLALGQSSLIGPLSGVLASLLSVRLAVFLGVILMSFGMLCASFSHSLVGMMFFYGFVTGLGFGISYSPVVVVISFYFEKHRMLANGIILCAPGLGLLSLPYFVRYAIDEYGWRFAMALLGGMILHVLVFASVFFPTDLERSSMIDFSSCCSRRKRTVKGGNNAMGDNQYSSGQNEEDETEGDKMLKSNEEFKQNGISSKKYDMILKSGLVMDSSSLKSKSQTISVNSASMKAASKPYIPIYINGTPEAKRAFGSARGLEIPGSLLKSEFLTASVESVEDVEKGISPLTPGHRTGSVLTNGSAFSSVSHLGVSSTPDVKKGYKFGQLRKGNPVARSHLGSSLGWVSSDLGSSIMLPVKIEEVDMTEQTASPSVSETLKRVCKNKAIWILCVNSVFFMCGCGIHTIHFPSYAESHGQSKQQVTHFYTVFGVVMMLGRLSGGMVFNRLKPPLMLLLFILQTLNGVALGLAPFYATNTAGIFVLEAGIALLYGQSYLIIPPIVAQIAGVGDMAIAFGIIHLFIGIGYIGSPILAGFIYDATETLDIPLMIGGSFVVLGALVLILIIFVKKEADASEDNGLEEDDKNEAAEEEEKEEDMKTKPLMDDANKT